MAKRNDIEELIKNNLKAIESMIEDDYTEKEVAEELCISYSSFRKYKSTNTELKKVIEDAKNSRIKTVEKSLYKLANGFEYEEEVITKLKEEVLAEDGKTILTKEKVEVTNVKKYSSPQLAAQKYFLNNRKKERWQDDPHKVINDKKNTKLKEKEIESKTLL